MVILSLICIFAACEQDELGGRQEWPHYAVIYDANGGTGSMTRSVHVYGTAQNLNKIGFSRTACKFVGWTESPSGEGKLYGDQESVINLTKTPRGEFTLYAQWRLDSDALNMILVPGGRFQMGNDNMADPERERPVRAVTIDGFSIGKYQITRKLYRDITGKTPGDFTYMPNHPVQKVTWYDAVEFCNTLSELEGCVPFYEITGIVRDSEEFESIQSAEVTVPDWSGVGYRLPTEAEWEYAAKAKAELIEWENGPYFIYSGSDDVADVAWYSGNTEDIYGNKRTYSVETLAPNYLGIHGMSGNVSEWCWDWSGDYSAETLVNPKGPESGSSRILRGGSWNDDADHVRSTYRLYMEPSAKEPTIGFRIVRSAE